MKKLPILYKLTTVGATQRWQIFVDGDKFFTESGQVGGAIVRSSPTTCTAKNVGKANETTPEEQALLEAQALYQKKLDGRYHESIDDIEDGAAFFEPMLAKKYNDYKSKIIWPALCQRKIDGMRMVNTKNGMTTRNGKDIPACPHIKEALVPFFKKFPKGMVDGEIYADNEDFEDVMSLVKKLKPTSEDLAQSEKKAVLWVFDGILDDKSEGFASRFKRVKDEIRATVKKEHLKYFKFVEAEKVSSHEELMAKHDKYVEEGFEGIILRVPDAPYMNKRSDKLLKFKSFEDKEFEILDIIEGIGGDAGRASKVLVKLKDGETSEAGIRGTDEYTRQLLKDRKKYIGKKATVRYQGFTKYGKLRFGVALNINPYDR